MRCKERIVELEGKSEKRISKLEDKLKKKLSRMQPKEMLRHKSYSNNFYNSNYCISGSSNN